MSIVYPPQALQLVRKDIGVYEHDKLTNFFLQLHILQPQYGLQ